MSMIWDGIPNVVCIEKNLLSAEYGLAVLKQKGKLKNT